MERNVAVERKEMNDVTVEQQPAQVPLVAKRTFGERNEQKRH